MRIKAFPRFERKRALKNMKCSCTLVRWGIWAIHRNFNTHLIRGCFKITYFLFFNIMLWFREIAFAGNQEPLNPQKNFLQHHMPYLPLRSHTVSFPCLHPSWIRNKCAYFSLKANKQPWHVVIPLQCLPLPTTLVPFELYCARFSEDFESFCKFSGQSTLHRYLFSQTYCQHSVLDHKYVFTWGWCW